MASAAVGGRMTEPYYSDEAVTLYHGDCREVTEWLAADVLVTDPPYGIQYTSGHEGVLPRSITGDHDTTVRDQALSLWNGRCTQGCSRERAGLVFGSWRALRPSETRMLLVWDTKGALGMGDLSLPWKPAHQEIYVLGSGFVGARTSDVLSYPPVQSMAKNGREHPHQKPLGLMINLVAKTLGEVADPFAGVGSTLIAAKSLGKRAIGVEVEERYCEVAAKRLAQGVLSFEGAS